jgi:hypothetical protein
MKDFSRRSAHLVGGVLELVRSGTLRAYFNLGNARVPLPDGAARDAVLFSSESTRYGGGRRDVNDVRELMPFECVAFGPGGWRKLV